MTAADVRGVLARHWPAGTYLSIPEAPPNAMRQGRTLDLLVTSLWSSRGFEREGVEIKVSVSDWRRELADVAKAHWWWERVHRFWVAVPAKIAQHAGQTGRTSPPAPPAAGHETARRPPPLPMTGPPPQTPGSPGPSGL